MAIHHNLQFGEQTYNFAKHLSEKTGFPMAEVIWFALLDWDLTEVVRQHYAELAKYKVPEEIPQKKTKSPKE